MPELDPQAVIEAIDREIAHFRKRVTQTFVIGFAVEALILAGKEAIILKNVGIVATAATYTLLFIAILVTTLVFSHEYLQRITRLKQNRSDILSENGYPSAFPNPKDQRFNEIRMLSAVIGLLTLVGIMVFWMNAYSAYSAEMSLDSDLPQQQERGS